MSSVPGNFQVSELMPFSEYGGIEMLAHVRKTPTVLYGIFVEIIRRLYSNINNHPFGTPLKVWDADPTKSQIWIDTELKWEEQLVEKRPAIYIKLGNLSYSSLTGRKDGEYGADEQNSEYYYTRFGSGSVDFVHLAGTAGEACALADSTMDYLDAFGAIIRDDFCFMSFFLSERIPAIILPKESKDRYGSVIRCGFEFQDKWTIKHEALKLKSVLFNGGQ